MQNPPLVSICIPTYNAAEFFEPCLKSALSQTYPNLEIVISDDGSTDDTFTIAQKYQQVHPHIRWVVNPSKGMVNNWNNSIRQAGGEWVKLLFQDDLLQPTCVEKMVTACLEHGVELGLCRRRFLIHDNAPRSVKNVFKVRLIVPERVFDDAPFISAEHLAASAAEHLPENIFGEPTCYLFSKRIVERAGLFNPEYKQLVDLEFILRLGVVQGIAFLPEAMAFFRVHGKSESSANINQDKEARVRNLAAITGDTMLLFHQLLRNPSFKLIKDAMGTDALQLYINYLYHNGCKKNGERIFNKALQPLREKYQELGEMRYSLFKYFKYRKLFKKWLRQNRW